MTNRHRIIRNAGILALASVAALFFLGAFTPLQHATETPHHFAPAVVDAHHDLQAHAEMEAYAALYFGDVSEVPDTFGGTAQYSPDWYLRWLEVEHDGHVALVYHLTSTHEDGRVLVIIWDSADRAWSGWDEIH